jgi:8-oxo-dGTP pyrophosphatase MutT (NUDIX family)
MNLERAVEESEWADLTHTWGAVPCRHYELQVQPPFLSGNHQMLVSNGRRAEICYIMHRSEPAQGLLLHIKAFYPQACYRLPTGGIHTGESVMGTLAREIAEETGLQVGERCDQVAVERFLGTTSYALQHPQLGICDFATYHFLVKMPAHAVLDPQDADEQIAGWQWRPADELEVVATTLEKVGEREPGWADWGRFRALSHRFVAECLAYAD